MSKLISINPSNYQILGEVESSTPEQINEKVQKAHVAQTKWKSLGVAKRVELLREVFADFASKKEELTLLEAREMGMPVSEALIDTDAALEYATWYFDNAEKYLSPEVTFENDTEIHEVFYEPIGVSAVIIPWNFPFGNFVWAALQNLICGNTVVFKHSEEVPFSTQFIERVMLGHGLPEGVFSVVYGAGDEGWKLMNSDINMLAFTGSTKVGKLLYKLAGEKFIKAVIELGGSAPGVVFADADVDAAVQNVSAMRLLNQGQACDGLKRAIVHEDIVEGFTEKIKILFENKKIGIAEDSTTEIGPLVSKKQLELLETQVKESINRGARVVTGGVNLEKELGGAFFKPTIIREVNPKMPVWNEEVFGPVLPILTFKTEEEAIALANDTPYGLGSYVYTKDPELAKRVSGAIQAGMVSVNSTNYIMPFDPFGGYKNSGFGREHGKYGFHEVMQIKVVARNK